MQNFQTKCKCKSYIRYVSSAWKCTISVREWFQTGQKVSTPKTRIVVPLHFDSYTVNWSDTRSEWPLARNPGRNWWHLHTSLNVCWRSSWFQGQQDRACCYDSDACVKPVDKIRAGTLPRNVITVRDDLHIVGMVLQLHLSELWSAETSVELLALIIHRSLLRTGVMARMSCISFHCPETTKASKCNGHMLAVSSVRSGKMRCFRTSPASICLQWWLPALLSSKQKNSSVMVLNAIGYNMQSHLLSIQGSLNSNRYTREVLKSKVLNDQPVSYGWSMIGTSEPSFTFSTGIAALKQQLHRCLTMLNWHQSDSLGENYSLAWDGTIVASCSTNPKRSEIYL